MKSASAVYKLWQEKNGTYEGGALLILWYGHSPTAAFDVIPYANVIKLNLYEVRGWAGSEATELGSVVSNVMLALLVAAAFQPA